MNKVEIFYKKLFAIALNQNSETLFPMVQSY